MGLMEAKVEVLAEVVLRQLQGIGFTRLLFRKGCSISEEAKAVVSRVGWFD